MKHANANSSGCLASIELTDYSNQHHVRNKMTMYQDNYFFNN